MRGLRGMNALRPKKVVGTYKEIEGRMRCAEMCARLRWGVKNLLMGIRIFGFDCAWGFMCADGLAL